MSILLNEILGNSGSNERGVVGFFAATIPAFKILTQKIVENQRPLVYKDLYSQESIGLKTFIY